MTENDSLQLDPKRTALIIQDLQNDVITERGAFADSGSPQHAKEQNVVENVNKLARAFRRAVSPVITVWYVVEKGAPEAGCSTMNADWHNASINYALQNVSTVTSCSAVLAALRAAAKA